MPWSDLIGHESAIERFRRSVQHNRLASTYLLVGPRGIGKHAFALKLAEALLCDRDQSDALGGLEGCGQCPACQQVAAQTHPDLILISRPKDKAFIPIETFIGDREHRRQKGLCHDIGLKPFCGGRKIAIIDDADHLNQEGANCLLKTLEEPPPKSLLILIGTSEQRQLSTIVSRSQVVRFSALSSEQVLSVLKRGEGPVTERPLEELAAAAGGSVESAWQLSEEETWDFRARLFHYLSQHDPDWNAYAKSVTGFVDAAGKDAAARRQRLMSVADMAMSFYRQCYLGLTGNADAQQGSSQSAADSAMDRPVGNLVERWQARDANEGAELLGLCIHRCGDLEQQVLGNVNQSTAVDAWLRDLSRLSRS